MIITKTHGIVDDVIVEEDEEADEDEPKPKQEEDKVDTKSSSSTQGQIQCKYEVQQNPAINCRFCHWKIVL